MFKWWCVKHFSEMGVYVGIVEAIMSTVRLNVNGIIFDLVAVIFWIGVRHLVRNRPKCGEFCSACAPEEDE